MKYFISTLAILLLLAFALNAKVIYVDKNGGSGKEITIRAALQKADAGDIIRIAPGIYDEQITIDKDVTVQGSGAKVTVLTGNYDPVVIHKAGKLMWVTVTSFKGTGVAVYGTGSISNIVLINSKSHGIVAMYGSNVIISNCIAINNGEHGFNNDSNSNVFYNCISINNRTNYYNGRTPNARYCSSYGTGGGNFNNCVNCLTVDPMLTSDYRLGANSQLIDGGDPTILDLDGSISDIGYYGGPDAPLLPYITLPAYFKLNDDGSMQFQFKARVGY